MKNKIFLLIIIISTASCDDNYDRDIDILVDGTWVLQNATAVEFLDFNRDMTYRKTGLVATPFAGSEEYMETGYVTGDWMLENSRITFLTAYLELSTEATCITTTTIEGQSIGSIFGSLVYGNTNDTVNVAGIGSLGIDHISNIPAYTTVVWNIEKLTGNTLHINCNSELIIYQKN